MKRRICCLLASLGLLAALCAPCPAAEAAGIPLSGGPVCAENDAGGTLTAGPAAPADPAPPTTEQIVRDNLWWMILVALSVFLGGGLTVLLLLKKSTPEHFGKRYEKRQK